METLLSKIKVGVFNADPYISDPRFRMSITDPRWNEYDEIIKKEVAFYNQKFNGKSGFIPLDWRWVKAMLWTEVMAGPDEKDGQWQKLPMQIGVVKGGVTDPGYGVVRDAGQDEGADLVVEPELKNKIQNKADVVGNLNVRTGIAYLFIRYVDVAGSKPDKITDFNVASYTIQSTDSKGIDDIAVRLGTTRNNIIEKTEWLTKENVAKLQIGQVINYQKAEPVRDILSWKDWMEAIRIYNIGDSEYIPKVKRAYQIIISKQVSIYFNDSRNAETRTN